MVSPSSSRQRAQSSYHSTAPRSISRSSISSTQTAQSSCRSTASSTISRSSISSTQTAQSLCRSTASSTISRSLSASSNPTVDTLSESMVTAARNLSTLATAGATNHEHRGISLRAKSSNSTANAPCESMERTARNLYLANAGARNYEQPGIPLRANYRSSNPTVDTLSESMVTAARNLSTLATAGATNHEHRGISLRAKSSNSTANALCESMKRTARNLYLANAGARNYEQPGIPLRANYRSSTPTVDALSDAGARNYKQQRIPLRANYRSSNPTHAPHHGSMPTVNPSCDMIINRPHVHVNPYGMVSDPYLQNLHMLLQLCLNINPNPGQGYQQMPAVGAGWGQAAGASYVQPTIPPEAYSPFQSGYSWASSKSGPEVAAGNEGPTIPPRAYPPSPCGSSGSFSRPQPSEVSKLNAFNKLAENVHGDVIDRMRKEWETEVDEVFNTQAELRQDKKKGLEQQLQRISNNTDELKAFLREVKKLKTRNLESVGMDAFSKQVLECIVSDLAIDDVIYLLDKAVEEGVIPFDLYLKNVRRLSRKQFYHRATATKVGASQMQAQAPLLNHQHRMI